MVASFVIILLLSCQSIISIAGNRPKELAGGMGDRNAEGDVIS